MPGVDRRLRKPYALLPNCLGETRGSWADLGCGDGIFTLALCDILGPEVEIFAVDRDREALGNLRHRFRKRSPQARMTPLQADFTRPLPLSPLDGMLMANALHFVPDREKMGLLHRLARQLKPGGRLIVVEYNTDRANPAVPYPLDEAIFLRLAKEAGLRDSRICARVPSTFLGEMYAGVGVRSGVA